MIYALVLYILTPVMVTKGVPPDSIIVSNTLETEDACKEVGQALVKSWEKAGAQSWLICYPGPDQRTPEQRQADRLIKHPLKHPGNIGDLPDPVKIGSPAKESK